MELCSGASPLRSSMCRNTDEPVGIPIPLPSVVPPIESWYVVSRKMKTGTCSIYSSWKNYQEENEISSPASSSSSTSRSKKKKRRSIDDATTTELAAFPTVAQAIAYVRNITPQTPRRTASPVTASITSSPSRNIPSRIIQSHLSTDDSESSIPHDVTGSTGASRNSSISPSRKRAYKRDTKIIELTDEDCQNDSADEDERIAAITAKSIPSPIPSENRFKKRKVDVGLDLETIPKFTNRPLTLSKTSETIDIGGPREHKTEMSSLDALAIAASASSGKKARKSNPSKTAMDSARLSPAEILASRGALDAARTKVSISSSLVMARSLSDRNNASLVASTIAVRNDAKKKQQRELLIKMHREDEELKRQIQEEEFKLQRYKARREALSIPQVPKVSPLSSLKIPEVPKGFVPAEQKADKISRAISSLKTSIDRKILLNNTSTPSMNLQSAAAARSLSNRLSLDSLPLGNFPSQLQQLPQQLQALQRQASLFRNSSNLLSMQLQSAQNPLIQHLRNGGMNSAQLRMQQIRNAQLIDLASSSSECDHSEITLKRRNGYSSETSSPMLGALSASKKPDSPRSKMR